MHYLHSLLAMATLAALFVAHTPSARAEDIAGIVGYRVDSLRSYNPKMSNFPGPLAAAADQIGIASQRSSETTSKELLEGTIASLSAQKDSIGRGLEDELYFLLGYANELSGDPKRAISAYDQSLARRSRNPLVMFRKAVALRSSQQCAKALEIFTEIEWITTSFKHEVQFERALCQKDLEQAPAAFATLLEVERSAPDFKPAKELLTQWRIQGLDFTPTNRINRQLAQTVADELSNKIQAADASTDEQITLAQILVKKSDPLVHTEDLKRAEEIAARIASDSDFRNEKAVRVLFDSQVKLGNLAEAERTITRGIASLPKSETLLEAVRQLAILREGAR